MRLTDDVYLVGSGDKGMQITDPFDCHVYLIDGGSELAVVDAGAGMGVDQILKNIENDGFLLEKLTYLLLTHAHADHAGGVKEFVDRTGVKVIASSVAGQYLEQGNEVAISLAGAKEAGFYPKDYQFKACKVDQIVEEGEEIRVGRHLLKVIDTPGHCDGHVSFYMKTAERNYLFAGDVVFYEGKVATQFIHDCSVFKLGNSIEKLQKLKVDALLPGHDVFVLKNGQHHINRSHEYFTRLVIPPSIIN